MEDCVYVCMYVCDVCMYVFMPVLFLQTDFVVFFFLVGGLQALPWKTVCMYVCMYVCAVLNLYVYAFIGVYADN